MDEEDEGQEGEPRAEESMWYDDIVKVPTNSYVEAFSEEEGEKIPFLDKGGKLLVITRLTSVGSSGQCIVADKTGKIFSAFSNPTKNYGRKTCFRTLR